jgi:hypothetical protein
MKKKKKKKKTPCSTMLRQKKKQHEKKHEPQGYEPQERIENTARATKCEGTTCRETGGSK